MSFVEFVCLWVLWCSPWNVDKITSSIEFELFFWNLNRIYVRKSENCCFIVKLVNRLINYVILWSCGHMVIKHWQIDTSYVRPFPRRFLYYKQIRFIEFASLMCFFFRNVIYYRKTLSEIILMSTFYTHHFHTRTTHCKAVPFSDPFHIECKPLQSCAANHSRWTHTHT